MSIESAKTFLERIKADLEFKEKVGSAKDKDERKKIVEEAGFTFTPEELHSVKGELTEEELDKISGTGWCWFWESCGETCSSDCGTPVQGQVTD